MKDSSGDGANPLKIPVAHGEGRYYADDKTLEALLSGEQVLYRYCDEKGKMTDAANPNGAIHHIAGICNKERNVFGMMPHPERACSTALGNEDGRKVFHHLFGIN